MVAGKITGHHSPAKSAEAVTPIAMARRPPATSTAFLARTRFSSASAATGADYSKAAEKFTDAGKAMTGQHVSGPRFFGLASTNKEDA